MIEFKDLPSDVQSYIEELFNDNEGVFECVDNERIAIKGNPEQEAEYEEAFRKGCCGSEDLEFKSNITGQTYLFGFNYGH